MIQRCPKCRRTFRVLEDEAGMHACPSCGYFTHEVPPMLHQRAREMRATVDNLVVAVRSLQIASQQSGTYSEEDIRTLVQGARELTNETMDRMTLIEEECQ